MIKVSVIVPVFNMEDRLDKCLKSLENQTLKDLEIVVINDGSTDNSLKIIRNHIDKYPNLYKLVDRENKGIGASRNDGISISSGECISFVDSDDYIELDMYEMMYGKLVKEKLDIVVCGMKYVDKTDNILGYCDLNNVNITTLHKNPKMVHQIDYGPCNKLFKRNLFNDIKFPIDIKYEDLNTILKVFYKAKNIAYIDGCYYNYYINSGGETLSINDKVYDIFKIFDDIKNYFHNVDDSLKNELNYLCVNKLMEYVEIISSKKDKNLAVEFYLQSIEYIKNNIRHWKQLYLFSNNKSIKKFVLKVIQVNSNIYLKRITNKSRSR